MRCLTSLSLIFLTLTIPAAAQQPEFGERVDVNAVLIDVLVTDKAGNQILGLGKEDFIVKEKGVRQTIDSLDYFTSRQLLNNREEKLPFDVERVREERYLLFFFDKPEGAGLFDQLARARASVGRFIDEEMGAGDRVAIVGHDVRLKVYSDFTADRAQLKRALNDVATFSRGVMKPGPGSDSASILRSIEIDAMVSDTGTVYEGLMVLADALRSIRGRKNLVLFSPGIREPGETVRAGMITSTSRYYEPMIEALNASNVTVYAANLNSAPITEPMFHQTLERMTNDTKGEYFRHSVSFDPILEQVEKATGGYYLLTYRSQKQRRARGFQKVDVTINNPEFKVKARPGYVYGETD